VLYIFFVGLVGLGGIFSELELKDDLVTISVGAIQQTAGE
jgi:hypothetical protein